VAIATCSTSKQLTTLPRADQATNAVNMALNEADKTPDIQGAPLKVSATNIDHKKPSSSTEIETDEQVISTDNDPESQGKQVVISPTFPVISILDYETNEKFGETYRYADSGELSGNPRRNKPILIMADRYVIDNDGLLYRVDLPEIGSWLN